VRELLAFLPVAVLVIVTPGPDTAITVRATFLGGRRAGVLTALGAITGQACWTLAASAGVTALLLASEPAFVALKLAGAAYLIYLGLHALWSALRCGCPVAAVAAGHRLDGRTAFRQGLVSDLGNPKIAAFFTSLLPQFTTSFWLMLALGLVFSALTFAWLALYATAVAKAGDVLRRPRVRRTLEGFTGAALIGLGVRVATEQR
jgi:threonine/homoserine/homoserine lactone efflux protein